MTTSALESFAAAMGDPSLSGMTQDELLARIYSDRPDLRVLLSALRPTPATASQREQDAGRADARLDRMKAAYGRLYDRASELADALGACVRCWGEDPACPRCAGVGSPGTFVPDQTAFRRYVLPALAAERAARVRTRAPGIARLETVAPTDFMTQSSRTPPTTQGVP
jgi:hypothetical protein